MFEMIEKISFELALFREDISGMCETFTQQLCVSYKSWTNNVLDGFQFMS